MKDQKRDAGCSSFRGKCNHIEGMEKDQSQREENEKKYEELYYDEKQQHEEALQRYKEDHPDEMEIIKLHKKCNKKDRKVLQPKALSKSDEPKKAPPKSDEPKKV